MKMKIGGELALPNGATLFWYNNEVGCRTYVSDEVGGGVNVWDTALVDQSTLLAAIVQEMRIQRRERYDAEQIERMDREKSQTSSDTPG